MTDGLDAALAEAAAGSGPDSVALMRVLIEATDEAEARRALLRRIAIHEATADHAGQQRLQRLDDLWNAHPQAWAIVRSTIAGIAHDRADPTPEGTLRYWADAFDRLAAASPEASVALYSLGSPALLAAATAEIVALLDSWGLLGGERAVLDLGCGIGRFVEALAPRVGTILGCDISRRMVEEARRRCGDLRNVRIEPCSGRDLAFVPDGSIDVVLAADVFPYLVQAGGGLDQAHLAEFSRVLTPRGSAVILNYSYRGDLEADRRDVRAGAEAVGLDVLRHGVAALKLWDGVAFQLCRPVRLAPRSLG